MSEQIVGETKKFLETHYPEQGGVMRLARELSGPLNRSEETVRQMFYNYRNHQDKTPDRFVLFYLWKVMDDKPVGAWARKCLDILNSEGNGLPV